MIFSDRSIKLIRAGKKTQTTRLKEPRVKIGGIYPVERNHYKKENLGKIKVIEKQKITLAKFTSVDLVREGYADMDKFIMALEKINRTKISRRAPIWKVIFERVAL